MATNRRRKAKLMTRRVHFSTSRNAASLVRKLFPHFDQLPSPWCVVRLYIVTAPHHQHLVRIFALNFRTSHLSRLIIASFLGLLKRSVLFQLFECFKRPPPWPEQFLFRHFHDLSCRHLLGDQSPEVFSVIHLRPARLL